MSRQLSLLVNDVPVALDYFVAGFIDHTTGGMIAALEGTGEIKTLDLTIEGDTVSITLNNATVPLNLFATKIIKSTVTGMVSPLKDVGEVKRLNLKLQR